MTERMKNIDVALIYKLWNEFAAATNDANIERWIALWIDDGRRMAPRAPTSIGKKQIRTAIESNWALFDIENFTIDPDEVRILGDQAFTYGTYTISMSTRVGGEKIEDRGKFLTILEKQADGSWKIAIDCFNSNTPLF
jgi:uncharacterized protein (TIGR02246 family)